MLLIWGFRSYVSQLGVLTFLCGRCQNPAAHSIRKVVRKFTLFFIPLFPISTKHYSTCTFCGLSTKVDPAALPSFAAQQHAQQQQPVQAWQQAPSTMSTLPSQPPAPIQPSGSQQPAAGSNPGNDYFGAN